MFSGLIIFTIITIMALEQAVLETLRQLSPEQQQEVLEFAEYLQRKKNTKVPLKSVEGLWSDLEPEITEYEITQARK